MRALNNFLLIEELERKQEQSSGLLIATVDKPRYHKAKVIESSVAEIEVGKEVLYDSVAAHNLRLDDKAYKVVKVNDIVIVF